MEMISWEKWKIFEIFFGGLALENWINQCTPRYGLKGRIAWMLLAHWGSYHETWGLGLGSAWTAL
jgi:hypothetical protein